MVGVRVTMQGVTGVSNIIPTRTAEALELLVEGCNGWQHRSYDWFGRYTIINICT